MEFLSREELKNVPGGADWGFGGDCATDKVKACDDKDEGNSFCFYYQGTRYDGLCRAYAPNYVKHCSDLNIF